MQEVWKKIDEFPNYEASSLGRIRSIPHKDKWGRKKGGTILKPQFDGRKHYLHVCLFKNGRTHVKNVHRIIAITFLENPYNYKEINHKDENKTNNAVSNLEWCTHKYNNNYGSKKDSKRGTKNPQCKINNEIADYILKNHKYCGGQMKNKDLAKMFNLSETHVSAIAHKRRWTYANSM